MGDEQVEHAHLTVLADDATGLAAIGKVQAFDRRYTIWSVVGIGVCVSSTWSAVAATILPSLVSGGAVTVIWGFVFVTVGMLLVTTSLAELASIWPSSGGQYHWAAELSAETWRPIVSWITGWLSFCSMILGVTGSTFAAVIQIQVYASACHPNYVPEQWHVTLIFIAVNILNMLLNCFGVRFFHVINISAIVLQVVCYVVILVVILACTSPNFNSAEYVFTNFQNVSGWPEDGVSLLIGIMGLVTGFIGVEAAAHFSEEMNHATKGVPRAMVYSTLGNGLATFPWLVVLLFSIGNIEDLVQTQFGSVMPIFQIILDATKNTGASVFLNMGLTMLALLSAVDLNGACARTIWAMARDNAFPRLFRQVHPKWDVPIWPMVTITAIECALSCIYIGNVTAFYGIISGILVLQMPSYAIPIALHLTQRGKVPYGPWKMSHIVGYIVNVAALCWCILCWVFVTFPIYRPTTAQNMNYSCVIFGAVLIISSVVYVVYARGNFVGPIREIEGVPGLGSVKAEPILGSEAETGAGKKN